MNNVEPSERELEVLQKIYENRTHVRQRDLARVVGLSLGMTNAIIKRLIQKGWLKARKVNERNIQYIVSPRGIEAIARRSYRYFKRTIRNVVLYREAIGRYIEDARRGGFTGIALVGLSDVDFIIEHLCQKHGLEFTHKDREDGQSGIYYLYSESILKSIPDERQADQTDRVYLRDILINL